MSFAFAFIGLLIITRSFLHVVSHFSLRRRMQLSLFWVAFAITSHFSLGHIIAGVPLERLLKGYDVTSGGLWPVILLCLAAAPFIWGIQYQRRSPQ